MKNLFTRILCLFTVCTLFCSSSAIAVERESDITEEELWAAVDAGLATVTTEIRDISSFTPEEIASDPGLEALLEQLNKPIPNSRNTASVGSTAYTTTIEYSGDIAVYRSAPRVDFTVVDVGTSGSSDITSQFTIEETVSVNGKLNTTWQNAIRYKNIRAGMGCGNNTAFTDMVSVGGKFNEGGSVNAKALFNLIASKTPYTEIKTIVSILTSINYPSSGSYSASEKIGGSNPTRAVGAKFKNELFDSDDFYIIHSSLSTEDSSLSKNLETGAATTWTFDVYYGNGSIVPQVTDRTLKTDVNYLVNVK